MDDVEPSLDYFKNLLVAGGDIEDRDVKGNTALVRACKWPDSSMVRLLLEFSANVHAHGEDGLQPLHCAAYYYALGPAAKSPNERTEVMKLLLGAGANLEAKDSCNDTPLSLAYNGCASSVRFLLDAGANPNTHGKWGSATPHYIIDFFSFQI